MGLIDRKLEIFRSAALVKNFTAAADLLGMTQPNVTHQIALLEKELGVLLFERTSRKIALTPAGEALLSECERLFAEAGGIRRRVLNSSEKIRHYRIGATMTAGGFVLPFFVAQYMKKNPLHRLEIHVANTRDITKSLSEHSLEAALVEGSFDRDFFCSSSFIEDELIGIAAVDKDIPSRISLKDYISSDGTFVLREQGSGTRSHLELFLKRNGIKTPSESNIMTADNFDAIKQLVRLNCGISVISRLAANDEINCKTLKTIHFSEGKILRKMEFIHLPDAERGFAGNFISFCRKLLESKSVKERFIGNKAGKC